MEGFTFLIAIASLVWAILNIILFFKIWETTNDIKAIKNYFVKDNDNAIDEPVFEKIEELHELKAGDIVLHESYPKEMRIYKINSNGMCICLDNEKDNMIGTFNCKDLKRKK